MIDIKHLSSKRWKPDSIEGPCFTVRGPSVSSRYMKSSSLRGTTLLCITRRRNVVGFFVLEHEKQRLTLLNRVATLSAARRTQHVYITLSDKSIRDASFKMFLLLSDYPTSAKHPRWSLLRRIRGARGDRLASCEQILVK